MLKKSDKIYLVPILLINEKNDDKPNFILYIPYINYNSILNKYRQFLLNYMRKIMQYHKYSITNLIFLI